MVDPELTERTLELARAGLGPSVVERQRLRAAIAARADALMASGGEAGGGVSSVRGWAALKASGKSGVALGAALLAVGFASGLLFQSQRAPAPPVFAPPVLTSTATPAVARAPSVAVLEAAPPEVRDVSSASADAPSAAPLGATTTAKPAARARRVRGPATRGASDAFERELALVQRAERAIRNRDPALALSLLGELDRQHPAALLGEERTAARVMANCQAQEPTASLAAERFLRESPNSVYSDRVRALCGLAAPDRKLER